MMITKGSVWLFFCFFKQTTAYEMRISNWSSDVCSSDLGVPQCIIDRLEAVEVDHQQRAARLGLDCVLQRAREILVEAEAVGQAGEIVVARHLGDLFGGRALFGDVRTDAAEAQKLARFIEARRGGQLPPARSDDRRVGDEGVSQCNN